MEKILQNITTQVMLLQPVGDDADISYSTVVHYIHNVGVLSISQSEQSIIFNRY